MPPKGNKGQEQGKKRSAPDSRPKSIRKRKPVNKEVGVSTTVTQPRIVETNQIEDSEHDEYVNAGDITDDEGNVDQNQINDAHGGTGAEGGKLAQGGANSDAAEGTSEGTSRFSFEIPPEAEPLLTDSLQTIMTLAEKKRVWQGEYINLHGFLPQVEGVNRPLVMSLQDGRIVSTVENKIIRNMDEWVTAFLNFTTVYLEGHPKKYNELNTYMKIVRFAQRHFDGFGWRTYDMQFRMSMRNNPHKPWNVMDFSLWALYVSRSPCKTREGMSANKVQTGTGSGHSHFRGRRKGFSQGSRGQGGDRKSPQKAQGAPWSEGQKGRICSFYTRGGCSKGASCQFSHRCAECQGNHSAAHCKKAK